jgi:hypothetical protein
MVDKGCANMAEQAEKITEEKLAEIILKTRNNLDEMLAQTVGVSKGKISGIVPKGFVPTGEFDTFEKIIRLYRAEMIESFTQAGIAGSVNDCFLTALAKVHCRILGIEK